MKKTFSKWCLSVKDHKCGGGSGVAFSSSAYVGKHHVVFLRAIFKLSFQISYTGNTHTTKMRNVNIRERKTREKVPVNASVQGVLPGYPSPHICFILCLQPRRVPIALCQQDHRLSAWFPQQRWLASQSTFNPCCYFFPRQLLYSLKYFGCGS